MTFEMYSSKNNDIVKEEEWKMETISRVDEVIECDADIENDEDEGATTMPIPVSRQ